MSGDLVVVTGTSSGLGEAIARRLLRDGWRVVGISRRAADLGTGYSHVVADLSDLAAIPQLVKQVTAAHGPTFGLVNNAASGRDGLLATMHNSEITGVIELDLLSPILLSKYLCRPMINAGHGRIVNITSIVARNGFRGLAAYSAAKAGLEGFTRSLARDLGARGVTVNCVAPGFVDTAMTASLRHQDLARIRGRSPLGRFTTVEEIAGSVSYLLTADAAGITGTVLTVDGGSTA